MTYTETPREITERGRCVETDPESFFPEKGASVRWAKNICAGCDVIDACREFAVANPELDGIWGGTTLRQRQAIRAARGAPDRLCARCGEGFTADPVLHQQKYCGEVCSRAVHHEQKLRSGQKRSVA